MANETRSNETPPSDDADGGSSGSYTDGLFNAFTGGLETGLGNYLGALGERKDSFGQTSPGGTGNPSVQYTRNPLTGELVNNATGQVVSGGGSRVASWVVVGGVVLLAAVAFMALRR